MPFTVKANFIDVFKIGDNINYNLKILKCLYDVYAKEEYKDLLIKPIVIINTSIAEALLYDFIENRIKRPNRSEILFPELLEIFKIKKFDKFEHYITQARKYDFFKQKDANLYEAMDSLRKKRNRIHIQNNKHEDPRDEKDLFNEEAKILSEKVIEKILNTMVNKYARREEYHGYVKDFELPWDKHFKS